MSRLVVVLLLAFALLVPASARANGDPASDVLLTQQVFLPFEAPVSKSAAGDLRKTVSTANGKGYKIRVALIAFSSDLGTAVSLWKHPEDYSKFLGKEIAFVYSGPLLVSMPSGFGFYDQGRDFGLAAAQAKLYTGELSNRAVNWALQIHGGYGYMDEYAISRLYRDQKILEIGEGTNEVQRMVIARHLGL